MNEGHLRDYMQRVECDDRPSCLCFDKELEVRKINGVKKKQNQFPGQPRLHSKTMSQRVIRRSDIEEERQIVLF